MCKEIVQERQPFDVAWQIIDGLKVRYATGGSGGERVMLLSPWPESIFAFAPVWVGLAKQFNVLAIDLPGFGRSEARDDLFAPQKMAEFIVKVIEAFGLTSIHAVGPERPGFTGNAPFVDRGTRRNRRRAERPLRSRSGRGASARTTAARPPRCSRSRSLRLGGASTGV